MNCIIVDDDPVWLRTLEEFVGKSSSLTLVGSYSDSLSARNLLMSRSDIELIFLDIEMPEMDGFDFLSSLENPPHIIFVSGSEEYAYKAFNYNGIDYLLKPITYPRFCRAVEKIMKYYAPRSVPSSAGEEEIFIKKGSSLVRLKLKEILFVEALENYVSVNTRDEKYTIHFTMRGIEQQLPSSLFVRIHRSYLVNKSVIRSITENSLTIAIGGNTKILPVGKSYRDGIMNYINIMQR
ncbi:MAG TPA: LytTR family DNA-binding domain-containing protein [Bacteroidales bacterium]|jgi:DNA-binding LytR/AlgR family response regulator|nr:response regulator transcription factor [Bacteroidales bacterium]MBP7035448.1 response regulator transcription factor [Bacteroidales bacterium]MBP8709006.1 response regulator transcription factor [Bacteroidales bacterium]MZQ80256.1 response regulator [Bacteroidales bacterium]HNY57127.1 LytTR family DNA-binding domain-containing protein [Bacteroidales bacterium]